MYIFSKKVLHSIISCTLTAQTYHRRKAQNQKKENMSFPKELSISNSISKPWLEYCTVDETEIAMCSTTKCFDGNVFICILSYMGATYK